MTRSRQFQLTAKTTHRTALIDLAASVLAAMSLQIHRSATQR